MISFGLDYLDKPSAYRKEGWRVLSNQFKKLKKKKLFKTILGQIS